MILGRLYDLALWPHSWPWPWSFKVRVWKALSQEWGGRFTMNEKDASHPFMTMILTCVTMVRWADVPDSDRYDFRRRRAVDIYSFNLLFDERGLWNSLCSTHCGLVMACRHCGAIMPQYLNALAAILTHSCLWTNFYTWLCWIEFKRDTVKCCSKVSGRVFFKPCF